MGSLYGHRGRVEGGRDQTRRRKGAKHRRWTLAVPTRAVDGWRCALTTVGGWILKHEGHGEPRSIAFLTRAPSAPGNGSDPGEIAMTRNRPPLSLRGSPCSPCEENRAARVLRTLTRSRTPPGRQRHVEFATLRVLCDGRASCPSWYEIVRSGLQRRRGSESAFRRERSHTAEAAGSSAGSLRASARSPCRNSSAFSGVSGAS